MCVRACLPWKFKPFVTSREANQYQPKHAPLKLQSYQALGKRGRPFFLRNSGMSTMLPSVNEDVVRLLVPRLAPWPSCAPFITPYQADISEMRKVEAAQSEYIVQKLEQRVTCKDRPSVSSWRLKPVAIKVTLTWMLKQPRMIRFVVFVCVCVLGGGGLYFWRLTDICLLRYW